MEICSLTSESPTNCRGQIPILRPPPIANPGACFCVLLSLQVCLLVGKRPHWGFLQHRSLPACLLCRVREFGLPAPFHLWGLTLPIPETPMPSCLLLASRSVFSSWSIHIYNQVHLSPQFAKTQQKGGKSSRRGPVWMYPLSFVASATALLLPTPLCLTPRPECCLPQPWGQPHMNTITSLLNPL